MARNFSNYNQGFGVMSPNASGGYNNPQQPNNYREVNYYGNNQQQRYNNRNEQFMSGGKRVKHSGARWIDKCRNKAENPAILAWNFSKRHGMISIFIAPYGASDGVKGTREVVSKKTGQIWYNWMCRIEGKGINEHFPVLVSFDRRMAVIRNGWNWVVNCNAPNKGYCGQYSSSNNQSSNRR